MTPEIRVSAAVVIDASGRALVVRKAGTSVFMQPGGKREPGETAAQALVREIAEELGVDVAEHALTALGEFATDAANEPGHRVVADAFLVDLDGAAVTPGAEIAEMRWIARDEASGTPLAPLSRDLLLPLVWR